MTRHEQLNELIEVFSFREKTVAEWTEERITTVLSARRRDAKLATKRADNRAALLEGRSLGQPSRLERLMAAAWLEAALKGNGDDLVNAVLHCGAVLTDDEAKLLAAELITTLRATDEPDPAT